MDPDYIAAKEQHLTRKPRPSKNPELFQQILAKNPYARALAQPLRRCALTYNVLPSFFLQDFSLMAHPETGNPCYVPRSLANKKTPNLSEENIDLDLESGQRSELEGDTEGTSQTKQTSDGLAPLLGYSVYTMASQLAIGAIQDPKGYGRKQAKRGKWPAKRLNILSSANAAPLRLLPERYRQSKHASKILSPAKWRSDMHIFVLNLMRRRLVQNLVSLTKLKRGYVVGCTGWEDALVKPQVGAFLWTGGSGDVEMESPPEFATLDVTAGQPKENKTKKVPVHNLRRLLGKEMLAELRKKLPSGIFEREVVVLKHKQQAVNTEMQLWKLQGYLAEHRDMYRDLEEPNKEEFEEEDDGESDFEDDEGE
jgi:hypothetical protein